MFVDGWNVRNFIIVTPHITCVAKSLKKSIASGAAVILAGNIINMVSSILAVKLLVKGLGSSGYGLYSRIISPILFIQPFIVIFGERYYSFKYLSSHIKNGRLRDASNVTMFLLLSRLLYGSLLTLAVYMARDMLAEYIGYPELAGMVGLASLIIFFNGIYELGYSLSLSGDWEKHTMAGSIAMNIFKVLTLVTFLFTSNLEVDQALISIIVGYTAGDSLMLVLTLLKLRPKPVNPKLYPGYFREMVSYSLPVVFQVLALGLCLEFPLVLFAHVGSNLENAILRVSNRYFKMVRMVGSALTLSMMPKIGSRESRETRITVVSSSIPYFAYVGSLLSAIVMSFPRVLLSIMSTAYTDYWAVLTVIGLSTVFLPFIPLRVLLIVDSAKSMVIVGVVQLLYTMVVSYFMQGSLLLLSLVYPSFYCLYLLLVAVLLRKHVDIGYVFRHTVIGVSSSILSSFVGQVMDNMVMRVQPYLPLYSLIVLVLPILAVIVFIVHVNIYIYLGGLSSESVMKIYTAINIPPRVKAWVTRLLKAVIMGKSAPSDRNTFPKARTVRC